MSNVTFDRRVYLEKLKEAGFDEKMARAQTDALDAALRETIVIKADLEIAKNEILRWMFTSQLAVAGLLFAALKFVHA
jgi:hypothetical protein